jgi:Peptidyl-prolyl cis-trans isomerase (rotamase) - cyclophilin family
MIKKIKSSLSEKILFIFLISLAVFTFGSFYLIKNKCLFVKELDLDKLKISDPKNLAIMDVECGRVAIELYPQVSPKSVERFKYFINTGLYNNSAFYRVIENTLVQAGDLEFGYHDNINYFKVGSGGSKLGKLKSELSNDYEFKAGTVAMARGEFDTEDSEFFIILKDIPLYQGEYTPVGKVIFGLNALKKLKLVIKQIMYCGLIILKNFSYLENN